MACCLHGTHTCFSVQPTGQAKSVQIRAERAQSRTDYTDTAAAGPVTLHVGAVRVPAWARSLCRYLARTPKETAVSGCMATIENTTRGSRPAPTPDANLTAVHLKYTASLPTLGSTRLGCPRCRGCCELLDHAPMLQRTTLHEHRRLPVLAAPVVMLRLASTVTAHRCDGCLHSLRTSAGW